jgi:hypothetical protein
MSVTVSYLSEHNTNRAPVPRTKKAGHAKWPRGEGGSEGGFITL